MVFLEILVVSSSLSIWILSRTYFTKNTDILHLLPSAFSQVLLMPLLDWCPLCSYLHSHCCLCYLWVWKFLPRMYHTFPQIHRSFFSVDLANFFWFSQAVRLKTPILTSVMSISLSETSRTIFFLWNYDILHVIQQLLLKMCFNDFRLCMETETDWMFLN